MNRFYTTTPPQYQRIIQIQLLPLSLRESSWGLSAWMTRVSLSIQSSRSASLSADNIMDFPHSDSCNSKQHFPLFGFWKYVTCKRHEKICFNLYASTFLSTYMFWKIINLTFYELPLTGTFVRTLVIWEQKSITTVPLGSCFLSSLWNSSR